ncbi:hypothetical protein JB92DRAFT_2974730 [Gautieria morchelliformis]|nr:hypothetical protein JB92DRAFT_2974730 [Gautieria morchelliformis]
MLIQCIRRSKETFLPTFLPWRDDTAYGNHLRALCTICNIQQLHKRQETHSLRTSNPSGCTINSYWWTTSFPRVRRPARPPLPRLCSPWSLVVTNGMVLPASELKLSSGSKEVTCCTWLRGLLPPRAARPRAFPFFALILAFAFDAPRRWPLRAGTVSAIGGGFTVAMRGPGHGRGNGGMGGGGVAGRGRGLKGGNVRRRRSAAASARSSL